MLVEHTVVINKINHLSSKCSKFTCIHVKMYLRSFVMPFIYSSEVKLESKRVSF